ncbi:N-acyl homoserine lactonase family protein [Pseudochelatococcus sp. B33]
MRLYCFVGGMLSYDQGIMTFMYNMGRKIRVPTLFFLIDHPKGRVLFETGLHPNIARDADAHWGDRAKALEPAMLPEQAADRQLETIGIKPGDIDYVVLSCLMYDHCGGISLFPDAKFILQFRELQDAWWPDKRYMKSYNDVEILPTRKLNIHELHDEDLDLFGDKTVEILFCPSHTRGEQALVVRLPKTGTVVLPAGVIPQRENLEKNIMTGTPRAGPVTTFESMNKLRRIIERENALVIYHHDINSIHDIRVSPGFYD